MRQGTMPMQDDSVKEEGLMKNKKKSWQLLGLIFSVAMVIMLAATPVYAAETEDVTTLGETTTAAASIDGVEYATLRAAARAATEGATVTLLKDVTNDMFVLSNNVSVTLDLNGHSVVCTDSSSYPYSPVYVTSGNLTITDNTVTDGGAGTGVLSTTKTNGAIFVAGESASVTVNAGNYICYSASGQAVQMSTKATGSTVTINGGTTHLLAMASRFKQESLLSMEEQLQAVLQASTKLYTHQP